MSEHNLILEFYKPTYNLDFDYDGDGGLDLHFTNIKGEFFMTMNDSYNSVYIEDEDCEFSKGEMFATVDLGDLVERIINGEFRQTNGKAVSDWGKRFIGDGEEQIEFNGKNYADGSLFWDDFFKEMSKDEIKDFMTFCEDYLDLPNIEVDTVSNKYDFENGKVELKSNGKWSITVNDDYTIILVDKFTCNSTDACDAYDVASSESDEDDYYESKKSTRKSLKESSKILAKNKKGKVVGYIEPQKDGSFGYAFGSPSQKEVIMFYVDTLEQAKDRIAEHSYDDVIFESKKSVKRSLKEEKVTDSLFQNIVFSMIKKFKLKKEYDVERPSWSVFNFRHKNKDAQFAITFDERGHGDFLYGEVLAFGDEKDDIFKYKTDEVKVDSYNIEKECSNIIADCLAFIDVNKKITIFESEKSTKKSLKENELFSSNTPYEIKVNGKKIKSHSDYEVVYDRVENDEYILGIKIKGVGNVQLRFSSKNEAKELGWIINESKKSARKNLKEGISAFNKAIAKKYNETEPNSVGQYYLDWRFDLQDEKDNIEAIADRCGVTVEFQSDEGYFEVFEESKKSARKSLKEYLVKGLDVDFVVDHLLSLEDPNNFDLINELDDLWKLYKKSWSKFNKSLSDFWKVMKDIEKLDSFDDNCKEIIDAWYDDIEKIFYSDDNLENLKLNFGFEGNDVF